MAPVLDAETTADLSLFELSRLDGSAEFAGLRWCASRGRGAGPGVRIDSHCDGQALAFWIAEADWCAWIAPQLAAPALAQIPAELLPPLASWTLGALAGLLEAAGLAPCGPAQLRAAEAPATTLWRLCAQSDGAAQGPRLPLYLLEAPPAWRTAVLAALAPAAERRHVLGLGLGSCLLSEPEWAATAVGDALVLPDPCGELNQFWLHPGRQPGWLALEPDGMARVLAPAAPAPAPPAGMLRLDVEAGCAEVSAGALADWRPGATFALHGTGYPALRLLADGHLMGLGELLRFDDGWAVRLTAKCAPGMAGVA